MSLWCFDIKPSMTTPEPELRGRAFTKWICVGGHSFARRQVFVWPLWPFSSRLFHDLLFNFLQEAFCAEGENGCCLLKVGDCRVLVIAKQCKAISINPNQENFRSNGRLEAMQWWSQTSGAKQKPICLKWDLHTYVCTPIKGEQKGN